MATKAKKPAAKKSTSQSKVTRITARDTDKPVAKEAPVKAEKPTTAKPKATKEKAPATAPRVASSIAAPFTALGGYFKGAWYELQQVTWPNRKATWSLTAALLVYTAFFAAMILLLDALFKYLFELILG